MKIGFLQYDVIQKEKHKNIEQIARQIKETDFEIYVLPELSNIGYVFDSKEELYEYAEEISTGETVQAIKEISKERGCSIIFGLAEKAGQEIYNTAVVISKGELVGTYRKIHLSDYEKKVFTSGEENKVFEVNGIKIGVQICFDVWFPEVSREQLRQGADLFCVLANFGGPTTVQIAKIRAIENFTPLVLCNRIGCEEGKALQAEFLGNSLIIDATGKVISEEVQQQEYICGREIMCVKQKGNVICKEALSEIERHYKGETR